MSWLSGLITVRRFVAACIVISFILALCASQLSGIAGVLLTLYFALSCIGLILKCFTDPRFGPGPYARAQKYKKSRHNVFISDYDETIAELKKIQAQCTPRNARSHARIGDLIQSVQYARRCMLRSKRDYAKPKALQEALELLDLVHYKHNLEAERIEEAAYLLQRKNDPAQLKKQGAPKGVIAKARETCKKAERAERLLLNRPKDLRL